MYMKLIIAVVFLLFLASDLRSQAQRRPVLPLGQPVNTETAVDLTDPLAIEFARLGPRPANASPHAANAVPVSQLRIPSKAAKEFERSEKALRSGDVRTSAKHLQNALQIYPDFIQAHNALGIRFMQLGEYQNALIEHQAALSLDPREALTHQDLSFVLLLLNRAKEAEAEAREALDLDSRLIPSRYVLGRALIEQGRVTSEGLEMLRQTQGAFPDASLVLAQIHFSSGQTDQTIADLRHYLRAPSDLDNKQKAECWVAQLSQQALPAGCPAEPTRPSFR
jgi:tetratricopeptide (TPR) repeat protein